MYDFKDPMGEMNRPIGVEGCQSVPVMNTCNQCDCCNKVIHQYQYVEVPHYVDVNTHVITHCIRKHITIPRYTMSYETDYSDEQHCCGDTFYQTR